MGVLQTCRTCRSWRMLKDRSTGAALVGEGGKIQGECHRNPPVVFLVGGPRGMEIRTQFPLPHSEMDCDEYSPTESVQQ